MHLRNRLNDPNTLICVGMACLALALLWPRFFHFTFHLSPDWVDGLQGMLFGIAIGMNLLAVRINARRRRSEGS